MMINNVVDPHDYFTCLERLVAAGNVHELLDFICKDPGAVSSVVTCDYAKYNDVEHLIFCASQLDLHAGWIEFIVKNGMRATPQQMHRLLSVLIKDWRDTIEDLGFTPESDMWTRQDMQRVYELYCTGLFDDVATSPPGDKRRRC